MKRFVIGSLSIDTKQKLLMHGTLRIPLAHKPTAMLLMLLEADGAVVTRTALHDALWPDAWVEEAVISRNVSLIRKTLRPHLEGRDVIETISKVGYRVKA